MTKLILIAAFIFTSPTARAADARLMTDAEYKTFLAQTEAALPRLERAFKRVGKESGGAGIVGLAEIHTVRAGFLNLRSPPRALADELDLCGYLQRLYVNAAVTHIYAPELADLIFRLNDDVIARVAAHQDR